MIVLLLHTTWPLIIIMWNISVTNMCRLAGRSKQDKPVPSEMIGAFGLSQWTDERKLEETFSKFGRLRKVDLVMDHRTRKSRCFAFITFDNVESATAARVRALLRCGGRGGDGK